MAGAAGYVLKQIKGDELVRAIRAVGAGQSLLDPAVTKGVLDRLRKGKHLLKDEKLARLSPQEERILALVADGLTNGQIGQRARPGREDGQELRLQHPGQARGRPPRRGRRLPGPPHHPPRQLTVRHPRHPREDRSTLSGKARWWRQRIGGPDHGSRCSRRYRAAPDPTAGCGGVHRG